MEVERRDQKRRDRWDVELSRNAKAWEDAKTRESLRDRAESTLTRLAQRLECEPRQVFDRVIRMLKEKSNSRA